MEMRKIYAWQRAPTIDELQWKGEKAITFHFSIV